MKANPKRYLVTAALPYANGPVHIGHIAGCYLPADIYVRYLRAQNKDVLFICGSDEHGVPITIKAKKENITPKQVVDKYDGIMRNAFQDLELILVITVGQHLKHIKLLRKIFLKHFMIKVYLKKKLHNNIMMKKQNNF